MSTETFLVDGAGGYRRIPSSRAWMVVTTCTEKLSMPSLRQKANQSPVATGAFNQPIQSEIESRSLPPGPYGARTAGEANAL